MAKDAVGETGRNLCHRKGAGRRALSSDALETVGRRLMEQAMTRLGLSARTIADLAGDKETRVPHLSEAIGYRRFDQHAAKRY